MKAHFNMMAAYNAWANDRLYAAAAVVSEEDYRRDVGAFFRSLMGTLNHLYVTDVLWMARLRELPLPPWTLDHVPHPRLRDLTARRRTLDRDIRGYVVSLEQSDLDAEFSYRRVSTNEVFTQRRGDVLAHFFNHQTHHRGQAHMILSVLDQDPPSLDLLLYQRGH